MALAGGMWALLTVCYISAVWLNNYENQENLNVQKLL